MMHYFPRPVRNACGVELSMPETHLRLVGCGKTFTCIEGMDAGTRGITLSVH